MSEKTQSNRRLGTDYGDYVFIRSLSIRSPAPGHVSLAMEDVAHSFHMDFTHDGSKVTSIKAAWSREPLSSCTGSPQALEALVGCPLSDNIFSIGRNIDSRQLCTHMYDMFCLAATHAYEQRPEYRSDVVIPDSADGPVLAALNRNGEKQLEFEMERQDYQTIVRPEPCRGMNILKGFLPWVRVNVQADQHEHYFSMQKALFIARIQLFNLESTVGKSATLSGPPEGSCYGSQAERYQNAVRIYPPLRWRRDELGKVLESFEFC